MIRDQQGRFQGPWSSVRGQTNGVTSSFSVHSCLIHNFCRFVPILQHATGLLRILAARVEQASSCLSSSLLYSRDVERRGRFMETKGCSCWGRWLDPQPPVPNPRSFLSFHFMSCLWSCRSQAGPDETTSQPLASSSTPTATM